MRKTFTLLSLFVIIASCCHGQTISTVAGIGVFGFSGDGGPATAAKIWLPGGVFVDKNDNIFSTDYGGYRVRKVTPSGIISTVAGSTPGMGGDGGPATAAQLYDPLKLAIDKDGSMYIADDYGHVVRKVDTSGIISTFAGNYSAGFGGDGGPAIAAQLNHPSGIACDTLGNVYISDMGNRCIRRVSAAGTISTFAGNHITGYSGDGGPATAAQLANPEGIFFMPGYGLLIADFGNNRVRLVNEAGIISLIAGNGTAGYSCDGCYAGYASLNSPKGVTMHGEYVYIADYGNGRIRRVDTAGTITTVAGNGVQDFGGDGGPATLAMLYNPRDVSVDSHGDLYIADLANNRIRKVWFSTAGVKDKSIGGGNNIVVFPEPAENSFTVEVPSAGCSTTISFSDISGKVIETRVIKPDTHISEHFFCNSLPHGLYVITVLNTTTMSKVIVH